MKGKKGQVGGLLSTVMIIVFALTILVAGFLLVQEILDLDNLSDQSATATDNNAWINSTTYTLDKASVTAFNSPVITGIVNATGDYTIELANATVTSKGIVSNATATEFHGVNITYTYMYGKDSYVGVNKTITAFLTIPNLIGLVILVILVGIVIAILTGIMPVGRTGTGA